MKHIYTSKNPENDSAPDRIAHEKRVQLESPLTPEAPIKLPAFGRFLRILGPGLITGAADDDPSGIATYSQAGAQYGYGMLWTMLFAYPMMTAVQEACVRIGAVQGKGLAAVIRSHYSRALLYPVVLLVVLANAINIGADIGAMAAAVQLVVPRTSFITITLSFTVLILFLEIFLSYKTYVKLLKWLAASLLAYPLTALVIHQNWLDALKHTVIPNLQFNSTYLYLIVAVFGTTISPYLFFWQTSEVVEEEIADRRLAQKGGVPKLSRRFLRKLRLDNAIGMLLSNVVAWFIIVTGAATLFGKVGDVGSITAAQAAAALEPLVQGFPNAGLIAKFIFATGIVGLGLLAVPVLAGSSSYALSEMFGWQEGLYRKFKRARAFYVVIAVATMAGLAINFLHIDPIKALVFTAVFNGLAAVPLIGMIMIIGRNENIMGEHRNGLWSNLGLSAAFLVMLSAAIALILAMFGH